MADLFANKNKFGVPVDESGTAGILMPKLKFRFRVKVENFGNQGSAKEFTQNVMNVSRPKISFEEVEIHSYNSKVYVQGKHTWETVTLVIRDDIQNTVSRLTGKQVQRQLNHFNQQSPLAGSDYKFNTRLEILDGQSTAPMETWGMEGCFLQNVDYSDSDYATNEPVTVTMTIRFDNALHVPGDGAGGGSAVAGGSGAIFDDQIKKGAASSGT
tara:strand:+ start:3121 stop:3759 length:639 start_codon:yes stop_codon:yes gene_type:complete